MGQEVSASGALWRSRRIGISRARIQAVALGGAWVLAAGIAGCAPASTDDTAPTVDAQIQPEADLDLADAAVSMPDAPSLETDAALPDAAMPDAALPDAALPDAALPDAAIPDAALPDAAIPDAAVPDAAIPDAAIPDAAIPDAAIPDAAVPDAAIPDAAIVDAVLPPDVPPGPPPCDPPLSISPTGPAVLAFDLRVFHAEGGTGDYTFELAQNASGAIINTFTGAYLSGEVDSTVDVVRVVDRGCEGSAEAQVRVVPPLDIQPRGAEVRPGQVLRFEVQGGSGAVEFALGVGSRSAGRVDLAGTYLAGPVNGRDVVNVTDLETGERTTVLVDVLAGATLRPEPSRIGLPVGATFRPVFRGGSGVLDVEIGQVGLPDVPDAPADAGAPDAALDGDLGDAAGGAAGQDAGDDPAPIVSVDYRDGLLHGVAPGEVVVHFTDHFTGDRVDVPVHVAAPLETPVLRTGDNTFYPLLPKAADIDGDGFLDVVLGIQEADHAGLGSGSVMVYRGRADGMDPVPVRVFSGLDRRDEFGRGLTLADYDDDGLVDLFIGAPVGDLGGADRGVVFVYRGVRGAFFDQNPAFTLASPRGGDRFGQGIGVCDVNGDGLKDLVVGAPGLDDITVNPNISDQGGVFVHLGYADGFLAQADQRIVLRTPDGGGGTRYSVNPRFGNLIATGDFDGDGLCDVATPGLNYAHNLPRTADGAVAILRGMRPNDVGPGGLDPALARFITASAEFDPDSNFGRVIATGDLDADGYTDLAVGQPNHDFVAGRNDNHGAVRIFRGGPFPAPNTLETAEMANWTYEHNGAADNAGLWVAIADATGDGHPDLISSDWRDELPNGTADVGLVQVYAGRPLEMPALPPVRTFAGRNRDERLASAVTPVGDHDGDGLPELFAYIARAPEEGYDVGLPVVLGGAVPGITALLSHPWPASGAEVGRAVGFNDDVDGDGNPEIVVGVLGADTFTQGITAGLAYLHALRPDGPQSQPTRTLQGFPGHSGSDQLGGLLANVGDFDGDGLSDLAVFARADDRPAAAPPGFVADAACLGALGDTGAVHIWRGRLGNPIDATPNFGWFPTLRSGGPQAFAGQFDANGDGRSDVLVGADQWDNPVGPNGLPINNVGAFQLLLGRAARGAAPEYVCPTVLEGFGLTQDDNLGRAVTGIGDVDGDGCDEFAVATPRETYNGLTLQGAVRIFRGFGGPGCPAGPTFATLVPNERNVNAGFSLAGGGDYDLDGRPDLAIGAINLVNGPNTVGGVWVVPGAFLARLVYEPYVGIAPLVTARNFAEAGPNLLLRGTVNGERFGFSVAWVPGRTPDEASCLAVGAPVSDVTGVARSGAVKVFCPESGVLPSTPTAVLGGETGRVLSRNGEFLAAGLGHGRRWIVVGAPEASGVSLDYGAAYVFPLDPP
jgi:hypothetical protein